MKSSSSLQNCLLLIDSAEREVLIFNCLHTGSNTSLQWMEGSIPVATEMTSVLSNVWETQNQNLNFRKAKVWKGVAVRDGEEITEFAEKE